MKNKYFLLLFLLSGCSHDIQSSMDARKAAYVDTNITTNSKLPKEYFIKHYKKSSISLYNKEEIVILHNKIMDSNTNINTLQKNDIFNIYGGPNLVKNGVSLEIWQYRGNDCVVNFSWSNSTNTINNIIAYNSDLEIINFKKCSGIIANTNN